MAHRFRFFAASDAPPAAEVTLSAEEAHHALRVARVQVGDTVGVFDGHGREWDGTVARATRRDVVIALGPAREVARAPRRLTLAQAWIKRDKGIETIIQRGTELGVSRFCFFAASRSERKPHGREKWVKYAIESCKQCGRAWLPTFDEADNLEAVLASASGTILMATREPPLIPLREAAQGGDVTLIVGPEGDFTEEERALAGHHGAKGVSLGRVTYRSEVAAILGATLVLYEMGEFGSD